MTFEEFQIIDTRCRLEKSKLFGLSNPALPAKKAEILSLEAILDIELPKKFKSFLEHYGGGEFGLINVFCADPKNEWYLIKKIEDSRSYVPKDFIPFSDDYAGGLYGFNIRLKKSQEKVVYWNTDGSELLTLFDDVFHFVAKCAYGK